MLWWDPYNPIFEISLSNYNIEFYRIVLTVIHKINNHRKYLKHSESKIFINFH